MMLRRNREMAEVPVIAGANATPYKDAEGPLLSPAFLARLERLALAVKRTRTGVVKGERKSKRKGASTDFADYRDYVQGDDLRHLDWNIYARLETLYLKLFQEYEDLTLFLLIDASQSMAYGSPNKISFAKRMAAALAYIALVGGDRVVIEAPGARLQRLEQLRGRHLAKRMFAFVESIEAGGAGSLERACRDFSLRNRRNGIVVFFSDLFDDTWEDAIRQLIASGSDVYIVQTLAPEEISPRLSGDLRLVDSESGVAVEVSMSPTLSKRYETERNEFLTAVRKTVLSRGAVHLPVSSAMPVEQMTLDILRRGGLVR